jgi:hypothetical protein
MNTKTRENFQRLIAAVTAPPATPTAVAARRRELAGKVG